MRKEITNLHHYHVDLFYIVIDMQLQELNNCFNEANTKLLVLTTPSKDSSYTNAYNHAIQPSWLLSDSPLFTNIEIVSLWKYFV